MPRGFLERSAAAMKPAAKNDDQARSPAAERLRRREEMRAMIIMAAAYKGAAGFRQPRGAASRDRGRLARPSFKAHLPASFKESGRDARGPRITSSAKTEWRITLR
jgi:hypothetical protein